MFSDDRLTLRLGTELADPVLAGDVVADLDAATKERLASLIGDDIHATPVLNYTPPTMPDGAVDSLWILAFGYRFAADPAAAPTEPGGPIPDMSELTPGPINEALAHTAAAFVRHRPVPVVAQWEVARVLQELGVPDVISVEPDQDSSGNTVYLNTMDVITKGRRLADEAGLDLLHAGVLGQADHASRCVMTAGACGLHGARPEGVALPSSFDAQSAQSWTRTRRRYIAVDLLARSMTPPSWFGSKPDGDDT